MSTTPLGTEEKEILVAARHDGTMRVSDGAIVMVSTNVVFRGLGYTRAFRSLRARGFIKWLGHSVTGGELYDLTDEGKSAG